MLVSAGYDLENEKEEGYIMGCLGQVEEMVRLPLFIYSLVC